MSIPSLSQWMLALATVAIVSCAGEATTQDFGRGYPGGAERPPPTQRGESTPTPNFPDCQEFDEGGAQGGCGNACFDCLNAADGEDDAFFCLGGAACKAYLAQFSDRVGNYSDSGNVLQTPEISCDDLGDPCAECVCETGSLDACTNECGLDGS